MKTELHVGQAAHAVVREELGYPGPVQFGRMELVEETQHSPRTGRPAEFHIHLIETTFPDLDLHQPGNRLEEAFEALHPRQLSRPGAPQKPWWEWVPLDALSTRSDLSPTWALVRGAIERLCAGKSVR